MSHPQFTAHIVLHFMRETGPLRRFQMRQQFEELSNSFETDRFDTYGYDDDRFMVVDSAIEITINDALYMHLKDGDYVVVSMAGELHYTTYTDWEGVTECNVSCDYEWHKLRVMSKDERYAHDELHGIETAWRWPKAEDFEKSDTLKLFT